MIGFSGRVNRHREQRELLESVANAWGEDWWFLGYLCWSQVETGDHASGIKLLERSLAQNAGNANATHARAHGYYESALARV